MIASTQFMVPERMENALIPEYEGESPADYPGDSAQFSIAGYDYGPGTKVDLVPCFCYNT